MDNIDEADVLDDPENAAITTNEIELQAEVTDEKLINDETEDFTKSSPTESVLLVNKLKLLSGDKNTVNPYRYLDNRRKTIYERLKKNFKTAPKSLLQKAEEKKTSIERQLEDSDKRLGELLLFGDELVTNIKVANEKRELLRRDNEHTHKQDLHKVLKNESNESLARFDNISSRWQELELLKEPMALFEELESQKDRIAELMQSKDNIIEQCQQEINRITEKYYADQEKQATDVCCLVERIDSQIELIKIAYKGHMDMLQNTIEDERQNIALNASNKWNKFYEAMSENEKKKFEIAKEKENFYAQEIERISAKQEEITRSTRIRLEKDSEMLEWELRNIKNNVLMNSEKLDYNYQVLQKRNEENVIINNQQKRRVAKLNEGISVLKKKIYSSTSQTDNAMRKLTADIQKLHSSISELEIKSQQFQRNNKKKFDRVWEINFKEIKTLLTNVFEIDKILHEQQLATPWSSPVMDFKDINSNSGSSSSLHSTKLSEEKKKIGSKEEQMLEIRFLRNILRKVADRAGFLVEAKLLKILEPYTDEEKCLVRIDNIFTALRIRNIKTVASLTAYFEPYSWCPNCSSGIGSETLKSLYTIGKELNESATTTKLNYQNKFFSGKQSNKMCNNHYLVIEPALVLTSLNEFTGQHSQKKGAGHIENNERAINMIKLDNETIKEFWRKFSDYMPNDKQKLWIALEHGLNHYLEVLKQRAHLYHECTFLRRQNAELKHLLQKFTL